MQFSEGIKISIDGIMSRKLRTFLTMLGVIFGVGAVIAMLSIQEGAKRKVLNQIQSMGTKNILVMQQDVINKKEQRFSKGLNLSDVNAIAQICPEISFISAIDTINFNSVWSRFGKSDDSQILGITPQYEMVYDYHVEKGRFISDMDIRDYERVCVLGYDAKRNLFGVEDALGKSIKLGKYWFKVVGVMERRYLGGGSVGDVQLQNLNKNIYIPITTVYKHIRNPYMTKSVSQIVVQVKNEEFIWETGSLINRILLRRHRNVTDFRIIIPEALLQQSMEATQTFNIVMGAIAAISLLVGGIGIMNIMLASVLERTREIGIRRAIGATENDILLQFLIESVMLSLSGGILGIIFGYFVGQGISRYAHLPTVTSWIAVVVSFVVAMVVGMVFGIYPARRAASLNPIEALRYE